MADEKLKACPFCGERVTLKIKDSGLGVILCPEHSPCFGSGFGNFIRMAQKDEAIAAWNTRIPDPELSALRERVKELEGAWNWFSNNPTLELTYQSPVYGDDDDQSSGWRVYMTGGSINDREWDLVGYGETALEAVENARATLSKGAGRDEF